MSLRALPPCDVLALGPHPDDVEIAAAGTLLLLRQAGRRLAVVDCTHGEKGSRGMKLERVLENMRTFIDVCAPVPVG